MWIFACGMQRSGSTLQFQIAAKLVEDAGLGQRVEWVKPERFPEIREKYQNISGWKVFKNHIYTPDMAAEFHRGNAMGIYVYRDPRDIFVSTIRKYSTTFNNLWQSKFLDQLLKDYYLWTALPNIMVSKYEDMVMDMPAEVLRIADHLSITLQPESHQKIAAEFTLGKQLERVDQARKRGILKSGYLDAEFDPHSMLHTNHIHKGQVGGWEFELSPGQIALIEDKSAFWMVDNGYRLSLNTMQRKRLKFRHIVSMTFEKVSKRLFGNAKNSSHN